MSPPVTLPDMPSFLVRDANNKSEYMRQAEKTQAAAEVSAASGSTKPKTSKVVKPVKAKANGVKAKPKKVAKERNVDPAKLDQFGFRKDSIKSQAAAMYAKGKGATLAEVKEACDSAQFNLLTELEGKGYTVTKTAVQGGGSRQVTRYKIQSK